jgi:hypothetical protein
MTEGRSDKMEPASQGRLCPVCLALFPAKSTLTLFFCFLGKFFVTLLMTLLYVHPTTRSHLRTVLVTRVPCSAREPKGVPLPAKGLPLTGITQRVDQDREAICGGPELLCLGQLL